MQKTVKIMKLSLLILVLFFNQTMFGQDDLTKKQYIKDFKQFQKIIKYINPQIQIRKEVTGYDILAEIEKNKQYVDTCSSLISFAQIIYKCLKANIDLHIYFPDTNFIGEISNREAKIRHLDKTKMHQVSKHTHSLFKSNYIFKLPIKYINGEYYFIKDFTYENKIYKSGNKITTFNGQNIHKYVQQNFVNFYDAPIWDFKNKRYFNETFFITASFFKNKAVTIEIEKDNKKQKVNFKNDSNKVSFNKFNNFYNKRFVKLIEGILYIKMPKMYDKIFFINEILKYNKENIKGVVIDVRGNMGGSDLVWQSVLSCVVAKPFEYQNHVFFLNNKVLKKEFGISAPKISHPQLQNQNFLNFTSKMAIKKSEKSLNYNGTIIVIQDRNIFSGTGNFVRAISQKDNVTVIGQSSGYLLGFEIMPRIFSLKYSNISFTLPTSIDIADSPKLSDIYHSKVDIEIKTSIPYYQNIFSEKTINKIIEDDIFIQKAFEILKQ